MQLRMSDVCRSLFSYHRESGIVVEETQHWNVGVSGATYRLRCSRGGDSLAFRLRHSSTKRAHPMKKD